jgi:ferritin-like metal-binding protein YciE
MNTAMHNELRDLHAARFAEMAALREMLVESSQGENSAAITSRMRDTVAEILRLQKAVSRLDG